MSGAAGKVLSRQGRGPLRIPIAAEEFAAVPGPGALPTRHIGEGDAGGVAPQFLAEPVDLLPPDDHQDRLARLEAEAKEAGIAMCVGKVEGLNQLERHLTEICRDLASS